MAHRSGDVDVMRSVGNPLLDEEALEKNFVNGGDGVSGGGGGGSGNGSDGNSGRDGSGFDLLAVDAGDDDADLPQCKIKRNYSCNLCPFFSQNPRSFLYHSRDVHFDRIKIFECSQCLYASKHSQKLQRHINMIHVAGKNRMKRTAKAAKIERKKELRVIKPKTTTESASPEKSSEANDVGSPASKNASSKVEEEIYEEMDNNVDVSVDGEYKCSVCNFRNKNQKLMRRHEKLVHLKKRFLRCAKCSYVTHVKARYTKHVKYHSMPMIKCDLCDFRTPYKWNLDRHYKNHCGTGAFQCSKCNFRADIKQSLTVHEMNHHVPPVGQGAVMARKKNKVGASDSGGTLEVPEGSKPLTETDKLEGGADKKGDGKYTNNNNDEDKTVEDSVYQKIRNVKVPYINRRESANNSHLQTDFIHPDDIVPRYGQIYVKNLKCKFCSYKAVFSHEIWRHEKRIHGFIRPESKKESAAKRPPPKLIPIQNKTSVNGNFGSPILKIPAVKKKFGGETDVVAGSGIPPVENSAASEKPVNENEFNEMCKKSCLTSSLKDFVSLIGDEEGLKTIPDSSRDDLDVEVWNSEATKGDDVPIEAFDHDKQSHTDLLKKKNASFFDKLKEKLLTGNNEEQSLFCEYCGHESKCLSESIAHQKKHTDSSFKSESTAQQDNEIVLSGAELSSTRCQHCRQRCKTSADLFNHLKSCRAFEITHENQSNPDQIDLDQIKSEEISGDECDEKLDQNEDSMENRVFVWNDIGPRLEEEEEREAMALEIESGDEFGSPLPPLYGTVTSKGSDNTESGTLVMEIDPRLNLTVKKVFKCPHCSFWASTASRFHVHIVGHLNKKPFECSLCLYRSNWRWDITKHIRLKSARDPSHLEAQVNMTDETGRRNYSKYNKYLTMMKVQEASAESSGTGRRSKPGEATQGNVAERDIIPLPAPPRLTRAPTPGIPQQLPHGLPLRPPPPLKAAHQISSLAKLQPPIDRPTKKTQWKCKKCNFRDSCKNKVLIHVKEHYEKKLEDSQDEKDDSMGSNEIKEGLIDEKSIRESGLSSKSPMRTPTYKCGHCQQVSNWKHVIQRHCRLKHNGNAFIQVGWKEESSHQINVNVGKQENVDLAEDSTDLISCDICPFTTDTEGDLTAHKLNHVDRPGSIFKCSYCPFYVPSKIAVLEHMEIHGVTEGFDITSLKVDNFDPSECNQNFSTPNDENCEEARKRYKCRQCPYLSNSRTQFLYHKQFHRPRDAPFKCMYCSYNVSRRHLLHQHLRVHHRQKESCRKESAPGPTESAKSSVDVASGLDMPDIPLVWVSRSGNFQKMFKCRWCPHVSTRKIKVQEHEKMHKSNDFKTEAVDENPSALKFQCSECNYVCGNAGVLSSHIKVHQGVYGKIWCLVDPTKPEIDQIRELQNGVQVIEPEVVIQVDPEGSYPKDENQAVDCKNENVKSGLIEVYIEDDELLSSHPENAYKQTSNRDERSETSEDGKKMLSFCKQCPARFLFKKELRIHCKFHMIHLPFRCSYCSYTARQRPHLLAHYRVHTEEYQEKTATLLAAYPVSPDSLRPETLVVEGRVWTVATADAAVNKKAPAAKVKPTARHACHLCPAKFFKSVALQYHLTLHGGSHPHKCKYCDYTVKTYGNLIKHQLVHEQSTKNKVTRPLKFSYEFPICEKDFIVNTASQNSKKVEACDKKSDPQFGTLMFGSPNFIYPTYLKNGKVKEKRYKCHKCPSAFEKRDQYRIHLSLHGSKQKYKCEKCDYSVKYYANYVQHMRKHQSHDEAVKARSCLEESEASGAGATEVAVADGVSVLQNPSLEKQLPCSADRRKPQDGKEEKRIYECQFCPYASVRRDALDGHSRRHFRVSNRKSAFECPFCDYSAPQGNFLRAHSKLHFGQASRYKAEAYLKCENMELWCCENASENDGDNACPISSSSILVFQDRGKDAQIRFFPSIEYSFDESEEGDGKKRYVDVETHELVEPENQTRPQDDRVSTQAESCRTVYRSSQEEVTQMESGKGRAAVPGPSRRHKEKHNLKVKRWRGKNWKCRKCPHAFGKRDQYLRHVALHGSNQKHNCDICDYSVKFYTNYVQHMRMHQSHEPDREITVKKNITAEDTWEKPTEEVDEGNRTLVDSDNHPIINDEESPSTDDREKQVEPEQENQSLSVA